VEPLTTTAKKIWLFWFIAKSLHNRLEIFAAANSKNAGTKGGEENLPAGPINLEGGGEHTTQHP
jgi:hypothetical protein